MLTRGLEEHLVIGTVVDVENQQSGLRLVPRRFVGRPGRGHRRWHRHRCKYPPFWRQRKRGATRSAAVLGRSSAGLLHVEGSPGSMPTFCIAAAEDGRAPFTLSAVAAERPAE